MVLREKDKTRFHQNYRRAGPNACWEWQLSVNHNGYGRFKLGRGQERAHRVSYHLHHGPIPDGLLVCHRCDNPGCVNPAHLFLGTPRDNSMDMVRKGRMFKRDQRGARNHRAVITEQQAREIIDLIAKGLTNKQIAQRYGVTHSSISCIRRGKTWKELPRPDDPRFDKYASIKAAHRGGFLMPGGSHA